jgi:hypothetical protein
MATDDTYRMLQHGVAVMTAWAHDPDNPEYPARTVASVVHDHGEDELIIGLVHVAAALLMKLEAHGESPFAVLDEIAERDRPAS